MRLVSIASGSSGNCIYAGTDNTHILIDAGISNKRIEQGLNDIGVKGSELDGVIFFPFHTALCFRQAVLAFCQSAL